MESTQPYGGGWKDCRDGKKVVKEVAESMSASYVSGQ